MAYSLPLPAALKAQGWKVKIRDYERLEPPHATVLRGSDAWRLDLRTGKFLVPPGGSWRDLPDELRATVEAAWGDLQRQWDTMYPSNPIGTAGRGGP